MVNSKSEFMNQILKIWDKTIKFSFPIDYVRLSNNFFYFFFKKAVFVVNDASLWHYAPFITIPFALLS